MKRMLLIFLTLFMVTAGAFAQAPADAIEVALLAAPRQMQEGATVVRWNADFTYETLREGTNRLVCYDRSGQPRQQPFSVECTSIANLDRVAQNMRLEAISDREASLAAFDAAEKDGTRVTPEFGSVWHNLSGASRDQARSHKTIAVPGATSESLGLPDNPSQGGVWIMNPGTTAAHLMTPGV